MELPLYALSLETVAVKIIIILYTFRQLTQVRQVGTVGEAYGLWALGEGCGG